MQLYNELLKLLMKSDRAFAYCCQYFIEDVTSWRFAAELQWLRENGVSERCVLARYMASWIPWEPKADKLIARIRELAGE